MDISINFYELKQQLAELGFAAPSTIDQLRRSIFGHEVRVELMEEQTINHLSPILFRIELDRNSDGLLSLQGYNGTIDTPHEGSDPVRFQSFQPEVPVREAVALLQIKSGQSETDEVTAFTPMTRESVQTYIHLKQQIMNTQNVEFLKKSLLNLGFGEKVNDDLEKKIAAKEPEFVLSTSQTYNQKDVGYALHFKAGDENEMYFLNKFEAALSDQPDKKQSFYINKGNGITAKEAFNLMEGRAVYKQLYNKQDEKYHAWLKLDNDNLTEGGNKKLKSWTDNYGYDIEQTISGKGIKEMATAEGQDSLIKSLKKGNAQQVTVEQNGQEKKFYITANPQYKTVDVFDSKMQKVKREELLEPKRETGKDLKANQQQKEELPAKKQSRKSKMNVG